MIELNVLIVDDEPGLRLGVKRALSNYLSQLDEFNEEVSFKTSMVENGSEALEHLRSNQFDILILDHKLPDIQGLEILAKINEEKIDVLTIMITAFASLDVAISATKSGAFDFLAKPFTPDELRGRIDKTAKHLYLKRKAQQFEQEKKQIRFEFIRVLAHELKAPLAAVDGYLNMMKGEYAGKEIAGYRNMIDRSMIRTDGMRKLILDILDLTRIESGNLKREIVELDLKEAVEMACEGVVMDAKSRNITVEVQMPEQMMINADNSEIQIILNNLITNAVKYNRDNGRVDLVLDHDEDKIVITCRDSGIGMSSDELKKLFGEFSRIKNSKTKDIMGSGLGLSILQKIVDLYDGDISVESEPDSGTTFIVTLKQ